MLFVLNIIPPRATHQSGQEILRGGWGKRRIGTKPGSKWETARRVLTAEILPHKPSYPAEGPLKLSVLWVWPWNSHHTKAQKAKGEIPCGKLPDCDNLNKGLQDVLTRLRFWNDDGQIADLHFRKRYGDRPRIEIEIEAAR